MDLLLKGFFFVYLFFLGQCYHESSYKEKKEAEERIIEVDLPNWLALKMQEGATDQGMWAACGSRKGQGKRFSSRASKRKTRTL